MRGVVGYAAPMSLLGPSCALHANAKAIGTCTRCGNFMCVGCAQGGLCEACRGRLPASEFAPCPSCRSSTASRVSFTWWGGALGPRLLTHVKCGACGAGYNGKTGRSNTTAIVVYAVAVNVLVFVLFALFVWS